MKSWRALSTDLHKKKKRACAHACTHARTPQHQQHQQHAGGMDRPSARPLPLLFAPFLSRFAPPRALFSTAQVPMCQPLRECAVIVQAKPKKGGRIKKGEGGHVLGACQQVSRVGLQRTYLGIDWVELLWLCRGIACRTAVVFGLEPSMDALEPKQVPALESNQTVFTVGGPHFKADWAVPSFILVILVIAVAIVVALCCGAGGYRC